MNKKIIVGIYEETNGVQVTGYMVRCLYGTECNHSTAHYTYAAAMEDAIRHTRQCTEPKNRSDGSTLIGVISTSL